MLYHCVLLWKIMDLPHSPLISTYSLIHHWTVQVCTSNSNHQIPFSLMHIPSSSFTDIGTDFQPSRRYLTFEPMTQESCVTVAIRDSVDLEMPESFFVILQRPVDLDGRILINNSKDELEVEIIDDDSAYVTD